MRHHRPEWGDMVPVKLLALLDDMPLVRDAVLGLGYALGETVEGRTLEHVVLRVARLRESQYEWVAHTHIALRRADGRLTEQEIARIAAGPDCLTGDDAATVQAVDDLLGLGRLGGATRQAIGERALAIKVTTLFYDMLASLMEGAEPENDPVPGLETPALATALVGARDTRRATAAARRPAPSAEPRDGR